MIAICISNLSKTVRPNYIVEAGDTWRNRHDTGKLAIVNECVSAGLVHDCEVYGLFADLIPAQAAAQVEGLQWGRARQGLIPADSGYK